MQMQIIIHGPEFNPNHDLADRLIAFPARCDCDSTHAHGQTSPIINNRPLVQSGHSSTLYSNQRSQRCKEPSSTTDRNHPLVTKGPSASQIPSQPRTASSSGLKSAQSQGRLDCPGPITVRRFSVTSNYLASPAFFINTSPFAQSRAADSQSLLPLSDAANCTQFLDKLTVTPATIVFHRHRQSSWLMDRRRRRLVGSAPPPLGK